jgi:hypothetical protein
MKATQQLELLAVLVCVSGQMFAQATPGSAQAKKPAATVQEWEYNLTVDGYIIPDGTSYVDPVFTADRNWLHLEARYNYENLRTGSLWAGYNFSAGDVESGGRWELDVTPMIGGVFGRTNGIAPGFEVALKYRKKIEASINNEYVFDTTSKSGNFYYSWPQLTYLPVEWFHVGAVAQHTAAYHTPVNIQRGFLVGFSHSHWEFTTYVFNPGMAGTTVVLEAGWDSKP